MAADSGPIGYARDGEIGLIGEFHALGVVCGLVYGLVRGFAPACLLGKRCRNQHAHQDRGDDKPKIPAIAGFKHHATRFHFPGILLGCLSILRLAVLRVVEVTRLRRVTVSWSLGKRVLANRFPASHHL